MNGIASRHSTLRVKSCTGLNGVIRTPGEKSISHRAILLSALSEGTSSIVGLSDGDDVAHTLQAIRQLGVVVDQKGEVVYIRGGRESIRPSPGPIDCGNSGTGLRLLAGVLAGFPFESILIGDESLSSRPMDRIADPLGRMGAQLSGQGSRIFPPLKVRGGNLVGIDWKSRIASAQVKGAILLAALDADGETVVREAVLTRTNTEEMLSLAGANISIDSEEDPNTHDRLDRVVRLRRSSLKPVDWIVPGDPSQSAFWIVGGCIVDNSFVRVNGIYSGPARDGFVRVIERMGGSISSQQNSDKTLDLMASTSQLRGTVVEASEIPSLDEIPILAVAAAAADGETTFRDVGELRVKEVDRLDATVALVEAFGARAKAVGENLVIQGVGRGKKLTPGTFSCRGDHRMAMAAAIAGLASDRGESSIEGFEAVATSYPAFVRDLVSLASEPEVAVLTPCGSA